VRRDRDARSLIDAGRAVLLPISDVPSCQTELVADAGAAQTMCLVPEQVLHILEPPRAHQVALRHAREFDDYGRNRDRVARQLTCRQLSDSSDEVAVFARCGRPPVSACR